MESICTSGGSAGGKPPSKKEGSITSDKGAANMNVSSSRSSPSPQSPPSAGSRRVSTYDMTMVPSPPSTGGGGSLGSSPSPRGSLRATSVVHPMQQVPLPLTLPMPSPMHHKKLTMSPVDGLLTNARSNHEASFPVKLHQLISASDQRYIRWQPENDGKSFTILNCDAFEREMLPRLYRNANIEAFGQLLSLYGFQRVDSGPYEGDYYHTFFVKDKPQLAHMIRKGADSPPNVAMNPTTAPTTYTSVPSNVVESMTLKHSLASSMHASVTSRLRGLSFPGKLHYLLCHGVYDLGLERIMRWQPGGHSFAVHSSEDFEIEGLAEMLGTPGHASFRAQLFLHGFQRVRSDGPEVEAYYHADFVREQPQLCRLIRSRNHLKSTIIRRTPSTPSAPRHMIVSPMSDVSVKSTVSAGLVPEALYLESRRSSLIGTSCDPMKMDPMKFEKRSSASKAAMSVAAAATKTSAAAAAATPPMDVENTKDGLKARKRPRVGQMMPQNYFPFKLHSLLTLAEKFAFQNILCWAPHGRCFLVNDKDLFCATVLPLFRHSEFASFRAQLKAYGFVRIGKSGPDKGAYYHTCFLRGRPELCATITRRPKNVNGTVRGRPKGRSYVEPDFYRMKFLPDLDIEQTVPPSGNIKDILEAALTQITPPAVVTREVSAQAGISDKPQHPLTITATHTSDFVTKLIRQNDRCETTLPVKLHALLNDAHDHDFNRIVTWNESGRSFSIADEQAFEALLCKKWLDIPSLAKFQSELELFGFKRRQNGAYYHEMFHKALPHLCRCIKRESVAKSDSSDESHPVIERLTITNDGAGVDVALSATDNNKRTNSPELEVAMALTAMDERSAEEEPSMPLNTGDEGDPIPISDDAEETAEVNREEEEQHMSEPKAEIMPPLLPPLPAVTPKPVSSNANKRRSMSDPPGNCDMLTEKLKRESEQIYQDDEEKTKKEEAEVEAKDGQEGMEGVYGTESPSEGKPSESGDGVLKQEEVDEDLPDVSGEDVTPEVTVVTKGDSMDDALVSDEKKGAPSSPAATTTSSLTQESSDTDDLPRRFSV